MVVADTSPLIVLSKIGALSLLAEVFHQVYIPPEVRDELTATGSFEIDIPASSWLKVQAAKTFSPIPHLHVGETAAIHLALELKSALLLIDDLAGRSVARRYGLRITGTIGFLQLAAEQGKINLADAFTKVKATDFRFPASVLDEILRAHQRDEQPR